MKKNIIRLNESQLNSLIKESVKSILKEMQENVDDVAKKVFDSIDFSQEYLDDVDTDSLDWEYTGDKHYEAVSPANFEKDGWKFNTWVEWSFVAGWGGSDINWDFYGQHPEIEYQSPEGQTGKFIL